MSVLGSGRGVDPDDLAAWGDVPVGMYPTYGPLAYSPQLRTLLANSNADLVHQHGLWLDSQWASLHWQRRLGGAVVISPHGMLDPWALRNSAWKKRMVGALFANESLRRAGCIHALCRSEAESIRACGLKNPIAVIPNGVDLPDWNGQHTSGTEPKKLLYLGRIHPKKGLKELIEAWALRDGSWRKEWRLVVAGWDDGGHEPGLKALAKELGMADSIEFAGPLFGSEKDAMLRSVKAFVLPSFSEGLPMSVLEAWAYGLPVLMTPFCNLEEGFQVGAAMRMEPTKKSISDTLRGLCATSAVELCEMGMRGRSLVVERFTWPGIAERMHKVYSWCLGGGSMPDCMEAGI